MHSTPASVFVPSFWQSLEQSLSAEQMGSSKQVLMTMQHFLRRQSSQTFRFVCTWGTQATSTGPVVLASSTPASSATAASAPSAGVAGALLYLCIRLAAIA